MKHLFLALLIAFAPVITRADCAGTDFNSALSQEGRTWVKDQLAGMPFPHGNHWTATKGERVIHIIGTLHISDARMNPIIERLTPLIADADAVLFETTVDDLAASSREARKTTPFMMIDTGPTLLEQMAPDDWTALSKLARARGIPPWMAAKMKPWFLTIMLSLPRCLQTSKDVNNGLDMRISTVAKRFDTPEISLETPTSVMKRMDEYPLSDQIFQLLIAMPMLGHVEDNLATTVAGYFDQDVARVYKIFEYMLRQSMDLDEAQFRKAWDDPLYDLLARRNINWLPRIVEHPGDLIVVAVGAAHLPGQSGVLNLLQNSGYTLQRNEF